MPKPFIFKLLPAAALAVSLALAGCGKPKSEQKLDQLDSALLSNQTDSARPGAPEQIVVDPAKVAGDGKAGRAPATAMPKHPAPPRMPLPVRRARPSAPAAPEGFARTPPPALPATPAGPTLGQLAATQAQASRSGTPQAAAAAPEPANVGPVSGECYANLAYGKRWAALLPAVLPLYPGALLVEAAGNEKHGCAVRIVSFTARAHWRTVSRWYRERAAHAGWNADETVRGGDHVVAGTAADGSAFYITLTPAGGSTATDMIVSLAH